MYYLGRDRVYRLERDTGEIVASLDIPLAADVTLAPPPAGLSVAQVTGAAFIHDGSDYLGEPLPSGVLWCADGAVVHLSQPILGCRRTLCAGEATVEVSRTGVFVPGPKRGLLRRRGAPRWYAFDGIGRVGPLCNGALHVWRDSSAVWGQGEWGGDQGSVTPRDGHSSGASSISQRSNGGGAPSSVMKRESRNSRLGPSPLCSKRGWHR